MSTRDEGRPSPDRTSPDRTSEGGSASDGGRPSDEEWLELVREYNRPPETPSGAIWSGIEERIGPEGVVPIARARHSGTSGPGTSGTGTSRADTSRADTSRADTPAGRRTRWGAWLLAGSAAAALVVVGIGVGRMTAPSGTVGEAPARAAAVAEWPATPSTAVRAVALDHLGRSGSLLEMVRADARKGRVDPDLVRWRAGLLAETRLLLDSPAAADPAMRSLLEDLELILAQMAVLQDGGRLDDERARMELQLVAEGVEDRDVLSRIRTLLAPDRGMGMTGI